MKRSAERILTSPCRQPAAAGGADAALRPPRRGEAVDAAEIDGRGRAAVRAVVPKQREAGIDVGNNGEQQREAFFLYVQRPHDRLRRQLAARRSLADLAALSGFSAARRAAWRGQRVGQQPRRRCRRRSARCAMSTRRRSRPNARDFGAALAARRGRFAEPFMTAPSPGIVAAAMKNAHYDTLGRLSRGARRGAARRVRGDRRAGFVLQIDAPDLALERHISYQDRPLARFPRLRRERGRRRSTARCATCRASASACTSAGATTRAPHDCDVPLRDILPALQQANVGGFVLPFANPRHAHEYRCFERRAAGRRPVAGRRRDRHRSPTTSSTPRWSPTGSSGWRARSAIRARVLAGTDCGFDTSAGSGACAEDVVWAKLARCAMARGSRPGACSGKRSAAEPGHDFVNRLPRNTAFTRSMFFPHDSGGNSPEMMPAGSTEM